MKDDNDITHFAAWMRENHPEIPLRGTSAVVAEADVDVRDLERRWRETGDRADLIRWRAALNRGGGEESLDPSMLPHFQALTEPLSPNVMVLVDDGNAIRLETRGSLPLPTDVLGMDSTFMLMLFGLQL